MSLTTTSRKPYRIRGASIDRDDLDQEQAVARLEANRQGCDPNDAARKARNRLIAREVRHASIEKPESSVSSCTEGWSLNWIEDSRKVVGLSAARSMTPGQRKKFLRNQVILASLIAGFSQRSLAVAFALPHSRIAAIAAEMNAMLRPRRMPEEDDSRCAS